VLVSEVMLQQTPVARVRPVYQAWLARWPTPADLADDSPGEAVRAWGRLGYPRRALRLHAAAGALVARHDGQVPDDLGALRDLPGVGEYTAAAVATFAYRRRVVVLDTNVRRVLARSQAGSAAAPAHLTRTERALAESLLPADPPTAARWSVALMELGALLCTASSPRCGACPLAPGCAWLAAGRPAPATPRRGQPFTGTDRQVRGLLLGAVRDAPEPVPQARLDPLWSDDSQRSRALESLLADGLLERLDDGRLRLPA
jgi:A/G-specific adenine glycosylase